MSGSNDTPGHQTPPVHRTPPTYEQARSELEEVVHRLEAGGITLEESLSLWERGEALAKACQAFLEGARARLDNTPVDGADAAEDPAR